MQSKKYDFIDFLRGIAILLVFINHIPRNEDILFSDLNIFQEYFFKFGTYGVQLFYIVSAFTLLVSLTAYKEVNYSNFFLRRIFRIVPIFFLGIVFYSFYLDFGPKDPMNIILNILFLNNIIPPSNDLIPGGSTISTEMNFYILLPLMFILINTYKRTLILIFFVIIILFILNLFFEYFFYDKYFGDANFFHIKLNNKTKNKIKKYAYFKENFDHPSLKGYSRFSAAPKVIYKQIVNLTFDE